MGRKTERREDIDTLTGLRALAAWWVVLYHLQDQIAALIPGGKVLGWLLAPGYLGVDVFFVLSGFIISYNYAERLLPLKWPNYHKFLWLRLARMYPVHLFTLLSMAVFFFAAKGLGVTINNPQHFGLGDFVRNVLLVHSWSVRVKESWNISAWSISVEWMAYIVFPLVLPLVSRVKRTSSMIGLVVVLLLLLPVGHTVFGLFQDAPSYGLMRILTEFASGCLLHRLYQSQWGSSWSWGYATALAIIGLGVSSAILSHLHLVVFWVTPVAAEIIYGLAWAKGPVEKLFRSRVIVYWGRVSYSLYMTHGVAFIILKKTVPEARFAHSGLLVRVGAMSVYIGVIIAAAVFSYHFVEEPARNWMRNLPAKARAYVSRLVS